MLRVFIDEGNHGTTRDLHQVDGQFRQVYFGRLVCLSYEWLLIEIRLMPNTTRSQKAPPVP
jgi:hypothetical protein